MKPYETYKDSGLKWIGDIPVHWEVPKIWHLVMMKKLEIQDGNHGSLYPKQEDFKKEGVCFIKPRDIRNGAVNFSTCDCLTPEHAASLRIGFTFKNDILLVNRGGTIGRMARMKTIPQNLDYVLINPQMTYIRCLDGLDSDFTYYQCRSDVFQESLEIVKSFGSTFSFLGLSNMGDFPFVKPPLDEQIQIANYLNQKTEELDTLIAKKEQLIILLQEERTAMINQAVTKGIDPNVPMKNSGIEWLGEIPEHWVSYRIDWVTTIVRGNSGFKRDELLKSGEYVALQYGKTYKVDIVDDSFKFFVNNEFYKQSQIVSKGDTVLISTSETIEDLGHSCYYNTERIGLIGGEQILLKPNREILFEKYLYQYSRQFCLELRKYAKGLKVFRFNTHNLKQIFIAIPSIKEQIHITDYLDNETNRIDDLINKTEQEIVLLIEYKTALISEVVTGKVDVRDIAL
ncbi:type I restriction enzyme, S subunit [Flavobacteriaceae bacterium MAR_2010_188]|nr:type I restriction enzyme, S subunit [Flavobacteriaceae bacterium MAR_2010_188]